MGAFWNLQLNLAVHSRYDQLCAQGCLRKGHRDFQVNVIFLTLEDRVFLHADINEEVALSTTARAGVALAAKRQDGAVVHTSRDLDIDGPFLFLDAGAMAGMTRVVDDFALAVALITDRSLLDGAKRGLLTDINLPGAAALVTGVGFTARFRSGAVAGRTFFLTFNLNLLFGSKNSFFK